MSSISVKKTRSWSYLLFGNACKHNLCTTSTRHQVGKNTGNRPTFWSAAVTKHQLSSSSATKWYKNKMTSDQHNFSQSYYRNHVFVFAWNMLRFALYTSAVAVTEPLFPPAGSDLSVSLWPSWFLSKSTTVSLHIPPAVSLSVLICTNNC